MFSKFCLFSFLIFLGVFIRFTPNIIKENQQFERKLINTEFNHLFTDASLKQNRLYFQKLNTDILKFYQTLYLQNKLCESSALCTKKSKLPAEILNRHLKESLKSITWLKENISFTNDWHSNVEKERWNEYEKKSPYNTSENSVESETLHLPTTLEKCAEEIPFPLYAGKETVHDYDAKNRCLTQQILISLDNLFTFPQNEKIKKQFLQLSNSYFTWQDSLYNYNKGCIPGGCGENNYAAPAELTNHFLKEILSHIDAIEHL